MGNIKSIVGITLRFLRWPLLLLLILVGLFATFYAISMLNMQADQISKISKYVDAGEISNLNHLASKDMKITQGLLYLSFLISFCCLFLIIIYLYISLLHARKTNKLNYNQADEQDVKR